MQSGSADKGNRWGTPESYRGKRLGYPRFIHIPRHDEKQYGGNPFIAHTPVAPLTVDERLVKKFCMVAGCRAAYPARMTTGNQSA